MKYYVLHRERREVVLTNFSKRTFHFGSSYFPDSTLSCFSSLLLPGNTVFGRILRTVIRWNEDCEKAILPLE